MQLLVPHTWQQEDVMQTLVRLDVAWSLYVAPGPNVLLQALVMLDMPTQNSGAGPEGLRYGLASCNHFALRCFMLCKLDI